MKKIRNSVFETNSSSTHSIIIKNTQEDYEIPKRLEVTRLQQTGRNFLYEGIEERFTVLISLADTCNRLDEVLKALFNIGIEEVILEKADNSTSLSSFSMTYGMTTYLEEIEKSDCEYYLNEIMESEQSLKQWIFDPGSYLYGEDDN